MCPDGTNGILDGLWCEGKCEGRKFALTLALTTETPINRAFQAESEGVRAKNKKNFFRFLEVNELTSYIINNKAISPFPFYGNEDMADVL